MTSSNGNLFHVTGPLCGEFTGHRWIPLTRPVTRELWCFLWSGPEEMLEWTIMRLVVWEREIKFISLFEDRGHRGPYSTYKPCNHNLYIGIIIFPHIDNPQSTGYDLPMKNKTIKIMNKKSEGPINLTNHWRKRLWISLHVDLKRLN